MSNIKIRFTVLKSNLLSSSVIFLFLATLSYFSRSLYDKVELSIPYEYIFLVILVLIIATVMSLLLKFTYIVISEPYRSSEETSDSYELMSYWFDRLFQFTNPKEYAKAIELGMR